MIFMVREELYKLLVEVRKRLSDGVMAIISVLKRMCCDGSIYDEFTN